MDVTATDAKNRLGQMLERCQREPVVIEKSGRRHSVLISAEYFDALVAASQAQGLAAAAQPADTGQAFYGRYKAWVDQQNALVEQAGIPGEEFRAW
ncbi:MAG: type II toxin-antitoxin system prevent-host-death family antitoxin [Rubrivivax sp.]|jgi:prevent-host-death family protein